jgi:hypothetical protein
MAANAKPAQAFHTKKGRVTIFFIARRGPCGTKVPGAAYSGATEATMSRIDPWEKAADCERAIQAAADPQQKTILKNLRYLWIALANESECMSAVEFAHESETIGRLHIALARARAPSLH